MHPEAHAGFGWALEQAERACARQESSGNWVDPFRRHDPLRVLDVGGQDINGTVYDYLPNATIDVLDLHDGPGVTIVADAASWEPEPVYDVVMCTEGFEHMPDWPAVLRMMTRALDPTGPGVLLLTAASTDRRPHGQHGALDPAEGEHYANVDPAALRDELVAAGFGMRGTRYLYPPGDVYAWAVRDRLLDITVVIPTIPGRELMLDRAVESVAAQTLTAAAIVIERDETGTGAAATRDRALARVQTPWVAFLDDDDEMMPHHLAALTSAVLNQAADYVFSWYEVIGGTDPRAEEFGIPWDPQNPRQTTITTLVRTDLARTHGFLEGEGDLSSPDRHYAGEDWRFTQRCNAAGARIVHLPEITWRWHHWLRPDGLPGNTSGLPSRW